MKRYLPIVLPILILIGMVIFFIKSDTTKKPFKTLPILGNHRIDSVEVKGKKQLDTTYHTVANFAFTNQNGELVTKNAVAGKIYVCDYFFTTCKSICPVMSKQLDRVYKEYTNNDKVMILSHTVDPETDTPAQLKEYAAKFKADSKKWIFLTGEKPALYEMARKSYLLNAEEGNGGEEDFIHTQNFALVDGKGRIRGFYDGTKSNEVDLLITDIGFLLKESELGQ